ncbi:hypothetical protein BDN70DRAFT_819963, partial [Pholiota conissans]
MYIRPFKRLKRSHYHDRVPLEDDVEVVHSRSSGLTTRNRVTESARSPQKGRTTWLVGSAWAPEDDLDIALDESGERFDEELRAEVYESGPSREEDQTQKQRRKRSQTADIRWEGRGDFSNSECSDCISRSRNPIGAAVYRCLDCFLPDLCCQACCVKRHQRHPFHCIERAIPRHLQLLRRGLYPASPITPQICATFQLLRLLHLLSLTSKASTYDLYRALERLTDNVNGSDHRSRYRPLLRIGLQWRHLKMLKRGGRGHDDGGIPATQDGDLAIKCPSCPHPGINLPDDWDQVPEEFQFLYCLIICLDANFRLKNQLVSNYSSDPGLGTGWAYMVRRGPYERYVLSQVNDQDLSTCVGFLAMAQALTRFARGLRYTGPLIPKFHEPAHHEEDHEQFSFNYATGVGNSDGEVPERVWAGHNGLGGSTKTHGPGTRQDVLDDHFGFWNWQKYCAMGKTFFMAQTKRITQAKVKEQLAKEDEERAKRAPALHSTSPSAWLGMGLELEDAQRRLRMRIKTQDSAPTEHQAGSLKEQRAALAKSIKNWESLRAIYIPGLLQYSADAGISVSPWDADPCPEEVELFLPSRLPTDRRSNICVEGLPDAEARLCTAQCFDALNSLRRTLRLKTRMIFFKNSNVRGQTQSTRSRALIDTVHQRALVSVAKYRAAREALLAISGPGDWEKALPPLLNGDVRSYAEPEQQQAQGGPGRRGIWEDDASPADVEVDDGITALRSPRKRREGTGKTKQTPSWIWKAGAGSLNLGTPEGDDEVLRSEWARSRARVQRCKEEVLLLLEEMRRVLQFLEWRASW